MVYDYAVFSLVDTVFRRIVTPAALRIRLREAANFTPITRSDLYILYTNIIKRG